MNHMTDQDDGYHPFSPSHRDREEKLFEDKEKTEEDLVWDPIKNEFTVKVKHPHV